MNWSFVSNLAGTSQSDLNPTEMENPQCAGGL